MRGPTVIKSPSGCPTSPDQTSQPDVARTFAAFKGWRAGLLVELCQCYSSTTWRRLLRPDFEAVFGWFFQIWTNVRRPTETKALPAAQPALTRPASRPSSGPLQPLKAGGLACLLNFANVTQQPLEEGRYGRISRLFLRLSVQSRGATIAEASARSSSYSSSGQWYLCRCVTIGKTNKTAVLPIHGRSICLLLCHRIFCMCQLCQLVQQTCQPCYQPATSDKRPNGGTLRFNGCRST